MPASSVEINGVNYTLPSGYTLLSYAESQNANAYIDISSLVTIATPITKLEVLSDVSLSKITTGRQFLFANGTNTTGHYVEVDASGKFGLGSGQTITQSVAVVANTVYHIHHIMEPALSKLYINDTESVSLSNYQSDSVVTPNTLFRLDNSGSYTGLYVQIHNYILKNNNTVLCVLVPVKDNNNIVGFYDFISKTFKTPASGTFVAGPVAEIQIATTKYVETAFADSVSELNTTMGTIKSVVDNTIIQADRIGKLHTGKQNRPDDSSDSEKCPAGRECLLITEPDGTLHWYPICDENGSVEPLFVISTFLAQLTGTPNSYYYHGNTTTYNALGNTGSANTLQPSSDSIVRQLEETEWAVLWNNIGVVYGTSVCNSNSGSYGVASGDEQTETKGIYCWCKMTSVGDTDKNEYPVSGSAWVFYYTLGSAANCASYCATNCALYVQYDASFRSAVVGVGN